MCLLLFVFSGSLFAQGPLFLPSERSFEQLKEDQNETLQRILSGKVWESAKLIDISPLDEIMGDRSLYLYLEGNNIFLDVKTVEYEDEANYYVFATREARGPKDEIGKARLTLRSTKGSTVGTIHLGENFYRIDDLGAGQNVLLRQKIQPIEPAQELDDHVLSYGGTRPNTTPGSRTNCRVRVLVLYTNSANGRIANINTHAQQLIDNANQGLANSSVFSSQLRFQLAGAEVLNTVNETGQDAVTTILAVRNDATAQARRNARDADLVCLIANDNVAAFGGVLGIAFVGAAGGGAPAANADGYSVVEVTDALNRNVFAHEVAHNMGCNHELADNPDPGFAKALDWTWRTGFWPFRRTRRAQTIMWSTVSGDGILNYSNPAVTHGPSGNATGNATANNAQVLRDNACAVGAYRSATNNLIVGINGPTTACPLESVCWSASVSGAPGPYTYQWAWTLNGTSYTNFGTSSSACLNMWNFTAPDIITIRLTVTAPGEPTRTAFLDLFLQNPPNGQILCALKTSPDAPTSDDLVVEESSIEVFPNPADLRSQVRLNLAQDGPVQVALYDMTGQKVMEIAEGAFEAGSHSFDLDASQMPAGMYLLQATTNDQRLMKRFVVTH